MKLRILLLTIFFLNANFLFAQPRSIMIIDTPTAYTIERGMYQVYFLGYDNGGVELKTIIGLHNNLFFGLSFDVQNAIGYDKAQPNVPGVVAKLKFTDGWPTFPISIAAGYDSFYLGQAGKTINFENDLNRMIYGPYFAITSPIYLFDDEQYISYGMRLPTQPHYVPEDASYFLSLDLPLGELFRFKAEGERVYYNFKRKEEWLFNCGLTYSYLNQLSIEVDIMFQRDTEPNRVLRIKYSDQF